MKNPFAYLMPTTKTVFEQRTTEILSDFVRWVSDLGQRIESLEATVAALTASTPSHNWSA